MVTMEPPGATRPQRRPSPSDYREKDGKKKNQPRVKDAGFLFYLAVFAAVIAGEWKFRDSEQDTKSKKHSKKYQEWAEKDRKERKEQGKKAKKYHVAPTKNGR